MGILLAILSTLHRALPAKRCACGRPMLGHECPCDDSFGVHS